VEVDEERLHRDARGGGDVGDGDAVVSPLAKSRSAAATIRSRVARLRCARLPSDGSITANGAWIPVPVGVTLASIARHQTNIEHSVIHLLKGESHYLKFETL
jgi:hypothetical protein